MAYEIENYKEHINNAVTNLRKDLPTQTNIEPFTVRCARDLAEGMIAQGSQQSFEFWVEIYCSYYGYKSKFTEFWNIVREVA